MNYVSLLIIATNLQLSFQKRAYVVAVCPMQSEKKYDQ